jgi:DNA-directed RNA polymerase specialized sigma24 family protein
VRVRAVFRPVAATVVPANPTDPPLQPADAAEAPAPANTTERARQPAQPAKAANAANAAESATPAETTEAHEPAKANERARTAAPAQTTEPGRQPAQPAKTANAAQANRRATAELDDAADAASAADAFDALYLESARALRWQVVVLTGDPRLAERAVERAFDVAWQQWPEVARDSDPAGWVRAAAHAYALAPWQRLLPGRRRAPSPEGRLRQALIGLRPERRRALLLYDGLGMSLAAAAAEIESSTTATAARIVGARRELATAVPEVYEDGDVASHLADLLAAEPDGPDGEPQLRPGVVRHASERGTRWRTAGAFALAGVIVLVTTVSVFVGPQHGSPTTRRPTHQQHAVPSPGR